MGVTVLEMRSLPSELLEWLGHLLGHLLGHWDHEAAWLFLVSELGNGICYITTKGLGLSGIGFVKLGSDSSFCT